MTDKPSTDRLIVVCTGAIMTHIYLLAGYIAYYSVGDVFGAGVFAASAIVYFSVSMSVLEDGFNRKLWSHLGVDHHE